MKYSNHKDWYGLFVNGYLYSIETFARFPSLMDFNVAIIHGNEYEILPVQIEF